MLQNGFEYIAAHIFGLAEFLVEASLAPGWKSLVGVQVFGLLLLVCGQFLRSLAMIHASTNFSHAVAYAKRDDHELVTRGVYAYVPRLTQPRAASVLCWLLLLGGRHADFAVQPIGYGSLYYGPLALLF